MNLKTVTYFVLFITFSVNTFAGGGYSTITSSSTTTENRAYAGLVWTLKEKFSFVPDATIGVRSLRVKSNDNVNGGDMSIRFSFANGFDFDSARISYVGGDRDILGNIGLGYSLTNSSMLGTFAIQGAYSRIGTDFEFSNKNFVPYIEPLTVDKPKKVSPKVTLIPWVC